MEPNELASYNTIKPKKKRKFSAIPNCHPRAKNMSAYLPSNVKVNLQYQTSREANITQAKNPAIPLNLSYLKKGRSASQATVMKYG